jgi:ribosome-binding factor A
MNRRENRAPSQRQLRVGEEIRHVLAEVLRRGELRDPELQGRVVTVTEVRLSPDLKNATAFIVPLGGDHSPEVLVALRRCAVYLRGVLARQLRLRYAPHVGFELDRSFDHAQRIEELLHRPDVMQDLAPRDDDADEDEGPPQPHGA